MIRAVKGAEKALKTALTELTSCNKQGSDGRVALEQRMKAARDNEEKSYQMRITALRNERATIAKQEADALTRETSTLGTQRAMLFRDRQAVNSECADEVNARLRSMQREQLQQHLLRHYVELATIPGISPTLKTRLRIVGIVTAADVNRHAISHVQGFGDVRTRAVMDWRANVETTGRASTPTTLPRDEEQTITARFSAKARGLEAQAEVIDQRIKSCEQSIRRRYETPARSVDHSIQLTQQQHSDGLVALNGKHAAERRLFEDRFSQRTDDAKRQVRDRETSNQELRARLLPAQWELAKIQRTGRRLEAITFGKFMTFILSFQGGLRR
jgi:DNA-binding helix-hairpin-helix protein with protein kinase domain